MMHQLILTTYIAILLTLSYPILPKHLKTNWLMLIKMATIFSIMPLMLFMNTQRELLITTNWWFMQNMDMKISLSLDKYAIIFTPIALLVSWSILEFSTWYMNTDPKVNQFIKYLMIFLFSMIILITSNNLFQFLIGWEGVGIMSFFLINWWFSRHEANASALQAILYNRIGDIGLVLTTTWMATSVSTWDIQQAFMENTEPSLILMLGLLLAAVGKSAQFGLHPWLPAAMEGPTPVSALLHSSTMVVAGVFLLIRMNPLMQNSPNMMSFILCLGAISTLFTALCATTQNDIKKIIAFSTSSQLGLMMVGIGLNTPELAFFHICTHAFFKALLFLCSGTIIHTINTQDIRKMGGLHKLLPLTSSCMTTGNLALMGTPFLSGFYSKDTLIEALCNSHLNAWALSITLVATMLTASYTLRMMYMTQTHYPRTPPAHTSNELEKHMKNPLLRLTIGSMVAGLMLTNVMYIKNQTLTMPMTTKLAALVVTTGGLLVSMDLMKKATMLNQNNKHNMKTLFTQLGFYNSIMHRLIPNLMLIMGQKTATQTLDQKWLEMLPHTATKNQMILIQKTTTIQKGNIKTYLVVFMISIMVLLTVTTLNYS